MSNLHAEPVADRLPTSAWVLAWLFLAGQVAQLMAHGLNRADGTWVAASMLLTALVVRWFADGVLRARTGRLAIVWLLLSAVVSLGFVGLAVDAVELTAADLVTCAFVLAQLTALGVFCTTDYFKDRRTRPSASRAALAPLLLIAVATGLLGGLTAPSGDESTSVQLWIRL